MMHTDYIPFHRPGIGEEEILEVANTLRSGWLTTGPKTAQFEREFRSYVQARHALALNSCTAALHLALSAMDLRPGDEVITTPLTFCATVNCILHCGATPVLADVLPDGNIDPQSIAERLSPATRVILPVHFAGLPCRMDEIRALARRHGCSVIEDAAHAAGARYGEHRIGSSAGAAPADAVAFSFYATKNLAVGEGGMLTTCDDAIAERVRRLALHGMSRDAWSRYSESGSWRYDVVEAGFKYNLSDIQSAIGLHQLRKLDAANAVRREIAAEYTEALREIDEVETPPDCGYGLHSWHLYVLRLRLEKLSIGRGDFIAELHRRGIGTSVHFVPIPLHPFFSSRSREPRNQCSRAIGLFHRIVSLPIYPSLKPGERKRVIDAVREVAGRYRLARIATAELTHS
ncbi:MAG: DegT/DnrJ/EryC1/StrS family aminotransferase [Bryobacteraceae bacterium]